MYAFRSARGEFAMIADPRAHRARIGYQPGSFCPDWLNKGTGNRDPERLLRLVALYQPKRNRRFRFPHFPALSCGKMERFVRILEKNRLKFGTVFPLGGDPATGRGCRRDPAPPPDGAGAPPHPLRGKPLGRGANPAPANAGLCPAPPSPAPGSPAWAAAIRRRALPPARQPCALALGRRFRVRVLPLCLPAAWRFPGTVRGWLLLRVLLSRWRDHPPPAGGRRVPLILKKQLQRLGGVCRKFSNPERAFPATYTGNFALELFSKIA